ncbi:hypothetical protein KP509_34G020500 [Ceratopteris richardii]|uniref:Pectate lyase n=1 Tax=Ceratopteris richardii TaxID=49495 RepID=A0A8T2QII1_CERRI|nr:hypothetical protein KP509_34G020500 [Ceratopteris richardii]
MTVSQRKRPTGGERKRRAILRTVQSPFNSKAMDSALVTLILILSVCRIGAARPFSTSLVNATTENLKTTSQVSDHTPIHRDLGYDTSSCETGNPIDDCWRCDLNWEANHRKLADCAIGFGRDAIGGRDGALYVVTEPSDDAVDPKPGTLRYAVIQTEPLWIIFKSDMNIVLKEELLMNSYKTIDGRGHQVHISNGPCITLHLVTNIIIHGIHVHDCKPGGNTMVRDSPTHVGHRSVSDGDGISLHGAKHVWVDHVSLARCTDGLLDATRGSTAITVSNSYFTQHNKVMLLGHSDSYVADKSMQATIAYNLFGEGLVQRMPRCRHGYFEVVNNDYTQWGMYAIGGSAAPTIHSKGNRYTASNNPSAKNVTKRMDSPESEWKTWDWSSHGDLFLNGAIFIASGVGGSSNYGNEASIEAKSSSLVGVFTTSAGALSCKAGSTC